MYLLKSHSDFDLLHGLPQSSSIVNHCKELGYDGCALTNPNLSGVPSFIERGKKQDIKAIAGLQKEGLVLLAKNRAAWKNLIKASNRPLSEVPPTNDFFVYSGYFGSDLWNLFWSNWKEAFELDYEGAKKFVNPDWEKIWVNRINEYRDKFGKENVYVSVQLNNKEEIPATEIMAKALRFLSKKYDIPKIWVGDSYYLKKEDSFDHRVLVCLGVKTAKLKSIEGLIRIEGRQELLRFYKTNNYHVPSLEEVKSLYTPDEIENADFIGKACESYEITERPKLPKFCENPDELLRKLCWEGWKKKIQGKIPAEKYQIYADRTRYELQVIKDTGILADYFLIVQDFCSWFKSHDGWLMGRARGSAGGCLVSYLTNITEIDPIEFDLSFERFYNAGRNTKDRVKLPDIDCDFPRHKRDLVIEYIKGKHGPDRIGQIATYHRAQGRAILKDVLRVHDKCGFSEVNRITDHIPDEAAISDKLQEMKEEFGESSIIKWALQNNTKELSEWAILKPDGTCEGELGIFFEQAIRLEGTRKIQSRHASGVVISDEPLKDCCPVLEDPKSGQTVCLMEMEDLETYLGLPKFDILGLNVLDKMEVMQNFIRTGVFNWPS